MVIRVIRVLDHLQQLHVAGDGNEEDQASGRERFDFDPLQRIDLDETEFAGQHGHHP